LADCWIKRWFVIFILMCILIVPVFAENHAQLSLIGVKNYSGVDTIGGRNLEDAVNDLLSNEFRKAVDGYRGRKATNDLLKNVDLGLYYEAENLCTNADLAAIGRKIGSTELGILEINGYNEIKREKSGKSYQLLLGLKVLNSKTEEEQYFSAEGLSEKSRDDAFAKAVQQLVGAYLGKQVVSEERSLRDENAPVIGHLSSRMYHLPQCNHLPRKDLQVSIKSRREAEQNLYRPCPVCFPPYKYFINSDRQLEETLGAEACGTLEYYYRLSDNPDLIARLRKIAAPIIADSTRKHMDIKFRILETDEINAFAAPNGYIYFTQGLLDVLETDDEIAFVIAHELGHIEKKHAVVSYRKAQALSLFAAILIAGTSNNTNDQAKASLFATVMANIIMKGYSRDQEREADEMAVAHLKRVNMDYNAYKVVMGKLMDLRRNRVSTIEKVFSTHPSPEDRIANLDKYLFAYEKLLSKL